MKVLLTVIGLTLASVVPVHADSTPNLKGYICIDKQGIHHSWRAVFDGSVYCKLIPNPHKQESYEWRRTYWIT